MGLTDKSLSVRYDGKTEVVVDCRHEATVSDSRRSPIDFISNKVITSRKT